MAQTEGKKWQKMLGHEHDQRVRLAEMVEQLAKQHSNLEEAAKAESAKVSSFMQQASSGGSTGKGLTAGKKHTHVGWLVFRTSFISADLLIDMCAIVW